MINQDFNENFYEELKWYRERNVRWSNRAMDQLSFLNNMITTLALGFVTFGYSSINEIQFGYTRSEIDYKLTIYFISFILFGLSVIIGLFAAHNRTLNFRITRRINQIRFRVYDNQKIRLDASTVNELAWYQRLWLQFELLCKSYPSVTIEECKQYDLPKIKEEVDFKFQRLRLYAHNMGISSWVKINWQIFFFLFAIITYYISIGIPS